MAFSRLLPKRRAASDAEGRRIAGVPERVLLIVGLTVFTLLAAASIVAALAS